MYAHARVYTSMISVCANLVQDVPGGVIVLTITIALGNLFSAVGLRSLQAKE